MIDGLIRLQQQMP